MLSPLRSWILALLAALFAQALTPVLGAQLPVLPAYGLGVTILVAVVLGVSAVAPAPDRRHLAWVLAPAALPLLIGLGRFGVDAHLPAALVHLGLLAAASLLGSFLGREIAHPGHLLPVAVVSSLADVYSVFGRRGPTAAIVESHPDVLAVVALPWSFGHGPFLPVLGVADVVFTALYLTVARTFEARTRMLTGLFAGYVTLFASLAFVERALPALPFLGAGALLACPEARRLPPADRRVATVGMVASVVLVAILLGI